MGSPIPDSWKKRVQSVLAAGDHSKVIVRQRALLEWSALFPSLFPGDLLNALNDALDDADLIGNQVFTMQEPGEVYEFIFAHANKAVYAKINMCPDGTVIIIYSAHRPLKGDTL